MDSGDEEKVIQEKKRASKFSSPQPHQSGRLCSRHYSTSLLPPPALQPRELQSGSTNLITKTKTHFPPFLTSNEIIFLFRFFSKPPKVVSQVSRFSFLFFPFHLLFLPREARQKRISTPRELGIKA